MKQTDRTPIYAACAVSPRIRNAEVRCSSHLSGTTAIITVSADCRKRRIPHSRRIMRQFVEHSVISTGPSPLLTSHRDCPGCFNNFSNSLPAVCKTNAASAPKDAAVITPIAKEKEAI